MADNLNKWDLESLRTSQNMIKREREQLSSNRQFLMNLESEVMGNWQSISGDIYLEQVEVDVQDLDYIIQAAAEQEKKMDKVINSTYQICEEELNRKLQALASSIVPR